MISPRRTPPAVTPASTWTVSVAPPVRADAQWRAQLLTMVRDHLARRLPLSPTEEAFTLGHPLFRIAVRRQSGQWQPGADLHLTYAGDLLEPPVGPHPSAAESPVRALPDERLGQQGERLVGLDRIRDDVLLRLGCRWEGLLDTWSAQTGTPVSATLRASLTQTAPLFVFAGDPGVGKSALAQAIADRYCRERQIGGWLLSLGTEARGNGLVGDFGARLRAAVQSAAARGREAPTFLLIDEADALAMRRSEAHAHQEDRAGTASLLQALDALQGEQLAVFLTTNLLDTLDAAVLRRGVVYSFERPDAAARRELLLRWFPSAEKKLLEQAVKSTKDLTPADLERVLGQAGLEAIQAGHALTVQPFIDGVRQATPTGRV